MLGRKIAIQLALALIVAAVLACRSETTRLDLNSQSQSTPQPNAQISPQSAQEIVAAPADFKKTFVGVMDGRLNIQMELERKGDKLTGSYFYDRPGAFNVAMKNLDLAGRIDKEGNATLTETSQNHETGSEQKTGDFKGKLDGVSVNGDVSLRFSGTWTGAKDRKQFSFALQELRFDLSGLRIEEKQQRSADKRLRYEIETRMPQLTGEDTARAEKFNKAVSAFVAQRTGGFRKIVGEITREDAAPPQPSQQNTLEVSYQVTAANKGFISLLFYFFEYTGGAHPNTTTSSFNYDFNRHAVINLPDLFLTRSNYLKVISDYAIRELKKVTTATDAESGAAPKAENYASWNITPAGLKITFDRYLVGPYAAGEHEVVIPYSLLKPIIKPDGLLSQFVN